MYRFKPFNQEGAAQSETDRAHFYHVHHVRSVMLTEELHSQKCRAIAKVMYAFCQETRELKSVTFDDVVRAVQEYWTVFERWPSENVDCSRFPNGLWIYCLTKLYNPDIAVESGVYLGFGTFLMHHAMRPKTKLFGFDFDINTAIYKAPEVHYQQGDWMGAEINVPANLRGFGFFDDHVSHALRIVEAYGRGFRGLLFDDNWPFCALDIDGWPPVPNVDMIMDDTLKPGAKARWMYNEKLFEYEHTPMFVDQCMQARELIEGVYPLPSVYRETGICTPSVMVYVELKQR